MAKNTIREYSATNASNTDIGGIGIQGSNKVLNFDDAVREQMTHLAEMNAGTAPIDDTFTLCDPADSTKRVRIDAGGVTTATTRVYTAPNVDGTLLTSTVLGTAGQMLRMNAGATQPAFYDAPLAGYIYGLTLSNNVTDATNDIDIAAGAAASGESVPYIMTLASSLTKQIDAAWAVGSGNGGLDTGSIADGWYHVWLIQRSDTGVVDALFSTSVSSPTMPTSYDRKRRIGSVYRVSSAIKAFTQYGDEFLWDVSLLDIDASQNTTAASRTLTVPTGLKVWAHMIVRGTNAAGWSMSITPLDITDTAPTATGNPLADLNGGAGENDRQTLTVRTNTSAQVRSDATAAATTIQIVTRGWTDPRGKF